MTTMIGKLKLSDRDAKRVLKNYKHFYEQEGKCSNRCPMHFFVKDEMEKWESILHHRHCKVYNCGFCGKLYDEFPNWSCPCLLLGNKAFKYLKDFLILYNMI